jgi:hypothetical protein
MPRVVLQEYHGRSSPTRLAVGDVIRCPAFRAGLRWKDAPGEVHVAWTDRHYPEYHIRVGNGIAADDDSRGTAPFLVVAVELTEAVGPDDVYPGNHRLSRDVRCVRLSEGMEFSAESERIRFCLDEPMSMARPDEGTIELLGYAELPISWDVVEAGVQARPGKTKGSGVDSEENWEDNRDTLGKPDGPSACG